MPIHFLGVAEQIGREDGDPAKGFSYSSISAAGIAAVSKKRYDLNRKSRPRKIYTYIWMIPKADICGIVSDAFFDSIPARKGSSNSEEKHESKLIIIKTMHLLPLHLKKPDTLFDFPPFPWQWGSYKESQSQLMTQLYHICILTINDRGSYKAIILKQAITDSIKGFGCIL